MESPALLALFGFGVGLLVGLTGMGGGILVTPFLIIVSGVAPVVAVGTDLAYSAATKWAGALTHLRQKTIDLRLALLLASGSIPGSLAGVAIVRSIGAAADDVILRALGGALMFVAVVIILRIGRMRQTSSSPAVQPSGSARAWGAVAVGLVIGVLVGISSVGSGSLVMVALLLMFPAVPTAHLVGTDLAQAALLTTAAGLAYFLLGKVDLGIAGALLLGSVPGVVIGSRLASRAPVRGLRILLAAIIFAAGLRLIWFSG